MGAWRGTSCLSWLMWNLTEDLGQRWKHLWVGLITLTTWEWINDIIKKFLTSAVGHWMGAYRMNPLLELQDISEVELETKFLQAITMKITVENSPRTACRYATVKSFEESAGSPISFCVVFRTAFGRWGVSKAAVPHMWEQYSRLDLT